MSKLIKTLLSISVVFAFLFTCVFVPWVTPDSAKTSYTVNKTHYVVVAPVTYDLSITGSNATVTVTCNGTSINTGSDVLTKNSVITVTATANTGYVFSSFKINNEDFTSGSIHTVTGDVAITYTTILQTYDLSISGSNGTVSVTKDGQSVVAGMDVLSYGDVITITLSANSGYALTEALVNNESFTSGNTITVTGDVSISYTTGQVLPATFGDATWSQIKAMCQANTIPSTWAVGDTKEITGKDGYTYHIRLVDKQTGRYTYSNDSTKSSNAVFEFVELPDITSQWNTSNDNTGGFADSLLRKNLNGLTGYTTNILGTVIPDDLADLLVEVNITTSTGGSSYTGISTSANKLFVGTYVNYSTTTIQQYLDEDAKGQFDYYQGLSSSNQILRKKALVTDSSSYQCYWIASPMVGTGDYSCRIATDGYVGYNGSRYLERVAPCFAF